MEELISVWEYEGIIRKLLNEIKSNRMYDIINELIDKSFQVREAIIPEGAYISYVPMWAKKEKEMGFNPAELIAKKIGERTGKRVLPLLEKTKETSFQKDFNRERRMKAVRGSFAFKGDLVPEKVVLVDDVLESGATMAECCRELKENGVKLVWGFTLARIS
jgi:competence protein ComFC